MNAFRGGGVGHLRVTVSLREEVNVKHDWQEDNDNQRHEGRSCNITQSSRTLNLLLNNMKELTSVEFSDSLQEV